MGVLPAQQPEAATAPAATAMPGPELLIDQFLPRYDFAVVHAQVFRVPPEVCLRAARRVDLLRHPAIRSLIGLRAFPQRVTGRLAGRRDAGHSAPVTFRVEDMARYGWVLLSENPSEIVLGQIGRPWKAAGASSGPPVGPAEFAAFGEPGYAKLAFNLRVDPHGATSAILTMETRVALTDPSSLRRFRRYWVIVGPFSGLIRQMALRLLAADLRQPEPTSIA
jgi:hypothetical protein